MVRRCLRKGCLQSLDWIAPIINSIKKNKNKTHTHTKWKKNVEWAGPKPLSMSGGCKMKPCWWRHRQRPQRGHCGSSVSPWTCESAPGLLCPRPAPVKDRQDKLDSVQQSNLYLPAPWRFSFLQARIFQSSALLEKKQAKQKMFLLWLEISNGKFIRLCWPTLVWSALLYWPSQLLVSSRTEVDLELVLSSPLKKVGKIVILIFFFGGGG